MGYNTKLLFWAGRLAATLFPVASGLPSLTRKNSCVENVRIVVLGQRLAATLLSVE
jgi:hypothetical protein